MTCDDLDVERLGDGPAVVLVHGSIVDRRTWLHQRPLAERWTLVLPNRPGFGASPPLPRGDFEREAPLVAELLGDGAHLVGHSYGAVIALCAAARRPTAVRSLTISEPGCLQVAAGHPLVDAHIAHGRYLFSGAAELTPLQFLQAFRAGVGSSHHTPERLDGELERGVRLLMAERPPWEARPPWAALRVMPFPKMVISGGHSPVFEAVCDAVARRIGARREVLAGRGHTIPAVGPVYNELLEGLLRRAGAGARRTGASRTPRPGARESA